MDITTVSCGSATRNALADYRDKHDLSNYDDALRQLLEEAGTTDDFSAKA